MLPILFILLVVPTFVVSMHDGIESDSFSTVIESSMCSASSQDDYSSADADDDAGFVPLARHALEATQSQRRAAEKQVHADTPRGAYASAIRTSRELSQENVRAKRRQHVRKRAATVSGLEELKDNVADGEFTLDEIANYFFSNLVGKDLCGFGRIDPNDERQREGIRGMLALIKATEPHRYHEIVTSITRGRSKRDQNKMLIAVLTKIVSSIDAMNEDSTRVGEEQLVIAQKQLATAREDLAESKRANAYTRYRYRRGLLWTMFGGTLTVIGTNVIQYVVSAINSSSSDDMAQLCAQMQNVTMS